MNHEPLLEVLIKFRWPIAIMWMIFSFLFSESYRDDNRPIVIFVTLLMLLGLIALAVLLVIHDDGPGRPPIFPFLLN